jgi:hypothetical protein
MCEVGEVLLAGVQVRADLLGNLVRGDHMEFTGPAGNFIVAGGGAKTGGGAVAVAALGRTCLGAV